MIRINLLPIRQTRKRETVQQQLLAFAGVLILVIFACVAWWSWASNEAEKKRETITKKRQELAQLDKIIGEVNEFTTKKKELEDKLKVIQQLKKGKTGPVRALDDLATEIPKRVWVLSLTEAGGEVTLRGEAIDHEDVSAFMKALQKSKYFSDIVLIYSKAASTSGSQFYQFEITCKVNYSA
jgi:type IV pilus assembly protein PilN